jgi:phage/plasmid-associated DNA primase
MELFLNSEEYKKMKTDYERTCFKLIGKYCINTGDKILEKSASEIHEFFKNKKITVEYIEQQTTKKGTTVSTTKELTKNFYQIWSEDPEMKEYLEVVFNCDKSKILPTQYNLFEGFTHLDNIKPKKLNLEPIFEHIRSLVDYNEEHFKYVISWFAQLVQKPHILPHTALIFISEEGVGKDLFSKFISEVINSKYTHNTEKLDNICGKFNSILGGKLLITINETNPIESRERIENIKFLITAEDVTIEGKHKDPVKAPNFCRFIFFSNRLFAFPVEDGSRRPVIFKSSSKYLPINYGIENNKSYFANLAENIYKNKEYQKAFLDYLLNYDIKHFNPKDISKSILHQELEENSISPIVHYLAHTVKTNDRNFRMLLKTSYEHFLDFMKNNHYKFDISEKKFKVELVSIYNIRKVKNNTHYFEFNIEEIKQMLIKKYKYNFEDDEQEQSPLDHGLEPEIDYKKLYFELLAKMKEQPKEEPKEEPPLKIQEKEPILTTEEQMKRDLELELELEKELLSSQIKINEDEKKYLFVPFEYRTSAKKDGAKFDKESKKWYITKSNPNYEWCVDLYNHNMFAQSHNGYQLNNTRYDDIVRKHKK